MSLSDTSGRFSLSSLSKTLRLQRLLQLPDDHFLWIAARTYTLSLSLSLGPALLSVLTARKTRHEKYTRLTSTLRKELGTTGFAFAMTTAVGGGAALEQAWRWFEDEEKPRPEDETLHNSIAVTMSKFRRLELNEHQKAFICNAVTSLVAITLMQARRRSSHPQTTNIPLTAPFPSSGKASGNKASATLDLTLLLFVRALDSVAQRLLLRKAGSQIKAKGKQKEGAELPPETLREMRERVAVMTDKLDALAFWIASARIMWCFFYTPERLPNSYVKWISALANVDNRLLEALRKRKEGIWTYGKDTPHNALLSSMSKELGHPSAWGDSLLLPAYGGKAATETWKTLGVRGRDGIGGLPCELVHGGVGGSIMSGGVGASCTANTVVRGAMGFLEGLAIYAPVHFLPILLTRPARLLSLPFLRRTVIGLLRSSLFLSTFISSIWGAVCLTRTIVIARLLPGVSHNFFDGPYGCILSGCLACGGSIWIEQGKRRGEMALYVFPRALRTILKNSWTRRGSMSAKVIERLAFVVSLSTILTASRYLPETLRGLSRWTVMFVMKGTKGNALTK